MTSQNNINDDQPEQPMLEFTIKCNKCGGADIFITESIWYSEETGGESASITCRKCGQHAYIH